MREGTEWGGDGEGRDTDEIFVYALYLEAEGR